MDFGRLSGLCLTLAGFVFNASASDAAGWQPQVAVANRYEAPQALFRRIDKTSADISLPEAISACIAAGPDKQAIAAFAADHHLSPWSEVEKQSFIERAHADARAASSETLRFELVIEDVAGWRIENGLSLYFLYSRGIPISTGPTPESTGTTARFSPGGAMRCEVGGFGGRYRDQFYEVIASATLPTYLYVFRRNVGAQFVNEAGAVQYFLSVSDPGLETVITETLGDQNPGYPIVRTNPPYGRQARNVIEADEIVVRKDQLDAILDRGSSFGFWVERWVE